MRPSDARRHAPATQRNREPILQVLRRLFASTQKVLEIASGSGEHAIYFGEHLPHLSWQPSDQSQEQLASIEAWRAHSQLTNVLPPIQLDVEMRPWPIENVEAIFCANMLHISPWSSSEALMWEAGRVLASGALLVVYGPFREGGSHTSQSNATFDAQLRSQNPEWGVRDRHELQALARQGGLALEEVLAMPANNHILVFRR